jgi:predicted dehydrogenase
MKTRIAILGVGRWGVHFVRNFLHHPQAEVVAIIDSDATKLAECREKFALENSQILLTTDWQSIRQQKGIDAVVIATPASTHYPIIADALQLGYHVLVEKPLTLDPTECLELTQLAQRQQRQLFIDHTYLFHPAVARGQQVLQGGQLGALRYGYASRTHLGPVRQDVDALWDLAIHDIAIFNYWLGKIPTQVQAKGSVWLQKEENLADLVWLTLSYPDGFSAYIHLCWLNPDKQRRLCVVGSQGTLIFDEMSQEAPLTLQHGYLEQQQQQFIPTNQAQEVIEIEAAEPLKKVCHSFLETLQTQQSCSLASGWTGTELVKILHSLSLSLQQEGKIVPVNS